MLLYISSMVVLHQDHHGTGTCACCAKVVPAAQVSRAASLLIGVLNLCHIDHTAMGRLSTSSTSRGALVQLLKLGTTTSCPSCCIVTLRLSTKTALQVAQQVRAGCMYYCR